MHEVEESAARHIRQVAIVEEVDLVFAFVASAGLLRHLLDLSKRKQA